MVDRWRGFGVIKKEYFAIWPVMENTLKEWGVTTYLEYLPGIRDRKKMRGKNGNNRSMA